MTEQLLGGAPGASCERKVPAIRVLVVDDHELIAESLGRLLDGAEDMSVVQVVGSAQAGIAAAARLHPDVVLMDYDLPDLDGVIAAAQILRDWSATKVVMLTGSGDDERLALRAMEGGCAGFVGKGRSVNELLAAVRAAHAGEALIAPSMLVRLLPRIIRRTEASAPILSGRELEVLGLMADGGTDKDIAKQLFISLNTARKHVQNIIRKLGANSKLGAVVLAVRSGVISPL